MHYDLVVIGATAAALGLAESINKSIKMLIINKTEMVAYEFVNTFKIPGVYSQGAVYYKRFRDTGVDILLNTDIIDIKKDSRKYYLEIFNSAGFQLIEAKAVVNTTLDGDIKIVRKSLNCLLVNRNGSGLPDVELDGAKIMEDSNEEYGTAIMKYCCDVDMELYEARHRLIDFWRKRPEVFMDWKIATIAFCFEEAPELALFKKDENYIILPSANFDTPEASLDAGVALGRSLIS